MWGGSMGLKEGTFEKLVHIAMNNEFPHPKFVCTNLKQSNLKEYAIHFSDSSMNLGTPTQKEKIIKRKDDSLLKEILN